MSQIKTGTTENWMLFLFFVGWKSNHFYDKKTTTVNALFVRLLFIYF